MNYYEKYIKYKGKYTNLNTKNLVEKINSTNKDIDFYTFNVLNPDPKVCMMTFNLINPVQSENIAKIDYERFLSFRINALISIINIWMNKSKIEENHCVICLQEVNEELLNKLKLIYNYKL